MKIQSSFAQVLVLMRPYRALMTLAILLALFTPYFSVWTPYLIGRIIDEGLIGGNAEMLFSIGALVLVCKVTVFIIHSTLNYALSSFGFQILVEYRSYLMEKILRFPISFFDRMSSGQLTTRLTTDINSLQELFSSALVPLITNTLLILAVSGGMLLLNWKLGAAALLILPAIVVLTKVFHQRIRRRFGFMRQALSRLNAFSAESFAGQRDIEVFGAKEQSQADFEKLSLRLKRRFHQAIREYALFNPFVPFLTAVMEILILVFGGYLIQKKELSVGELVAFLSYATYFGGPLRDLAEKFTVLQQALASVDRLVELNHEKEEVDEGKLTLTPFHQLQFSGVQLIYNGSTAPAVSDLSFRVRRGEKIALLGATGSGKTTTCSLLQRFYDPTQGQILIDGVDLRSFTLKSLRSQIGWVSQDVILFSQTLRENLEIYSSKTDQEIWQILRIVQLADWVASLPNGLDTILPERGSNLSSGQRQLLSLARALLKNPSLLIFDEATAYIDIQTEAIIQNALEDLWKLPEFEKMTGFFIAHRLSTLRRCDRLFVFQGGRVVESGTHEDLMEKNGYAAQLYQKQYRRLNREGASA